MLVLLKAEVLKSHVNALERHRRHRQTLACSPSLLCTHKQLTLTPTHGIQPHSSRITTSTMTGSSTGEVVDVMSKAQWDALLKGKVMMVMLAWQLPPHGTKHRKKAALPKPPAPRLPGTS